jgi:hypothetical protein
MDTNIAQGLIESIDFHYVKSIIRSDKRLKSFWGGKTPSRADLKRVILNMIDRVSEHGEAEDCVNGIVVRKYSDMIRVDFLYLSYSSQTEESQQCNEEDCSQDSEREIESS